MPRNMSDDEVEKILRRMPDMLDTAMVPIVVAAKHDCVSTQTVRKHYPLVRLSPGRWGVPVAFLRTRRLPTA